MQLATHGVSRVQEVVTRLRSYRVMTRLVSEGCSSTTTIIVLRSLSRPTQSLPRPLSTLTSDVFVETSLSLLTRENTRSVSYLPKYIQFDFNRDKMYVEVKCILL